MKIYTRTGDSGETGLFGAMRIRKNDPRVEAYGTIDELNATLGMARAADLPEALDTALTRLQSELFVLGAEVACAPGKTDKLKMELIGDAQVSALEDLIDEHEGHLPALKTFVLPAGSPAGATLHLARTVARRAERRCLDLNDLRPQVVTYLNRLSDCLFVLARRANHLAAAAETPWTPR
jgi:cob(I)alamin adenosyltransferase